MMIYATMRDGSQVKFTNIDELFAFVNTNTDATGGYIGVE